MTKMMNNLQTNSIDSFLNEGTVASDIAQSTGSMGLQKRKRKGQSDDCPCKKDPMSEECQKKRLALQESNVEMMAARDIADAAGKCSKKIKIIGTFDEIGIMTRDAGFEMEYNGEIFQVTVVQK